MYHSHDRTDWIDPVKQREQREEYLNQLADLEHEKLQQQVDQEYRAKRNRTQSLPSSPLAAAATLHFNLHQATTPTTTTGTETSAASTLASTPPPSASSSSVSSSSLGAAGAFSTPTPHRSIASIVDQVVKANKAATASSTTAQPPPSASSSSSSSASSSELTESDIPDLYATRSDSLFDDGLINARNNAGLLFETHSFRAPGLDQSYLYPHLQEAAIRAAEKAKQVVAERKKEETESEENAEAEKEKEMMREQEKEQRQEKNKKKGNRNNGSSNGNSNKEDNNKAIGFERAVTNEQMQEMRRDE